jgi:acid phosphatase type 7
MAPDLLTRVGVLASILPRLHSSRLLALAGAVVALASCNSNLSGRIAAIGTGDISTPALERLVPGANGACGVPTTTPVAGSALRRRPYLQAVSSDAASVVWTASADAPGPASVSVTTTDGQPVATVNAEQDTRAVLPRGVVQWQADVRALSAATRYCYEVRHGSVPMLSGASLQTAPEPGTGTPIRVLVIGDSGGGGSDQRALLRQIETVPADLMIHTGDIAYDNGTLDDFENTFFDVYAPLLDHTPAFPITGNHDYRTGDAAPFRQVFVLPENGGVEGLERWYSFDWGDIHFVALDTEQTDEVQAAWLEADLATNQLPWTIVYAHKPPFSSGEHGGDPLFQLLFIPILERHAVDLVLGGHDHHYERFNPKANILYVVTGGGGRGVRLISKGLDTAFAEAVIHLVAIEVKDDRLTLHAIDGVGREFDSAVIQKAAADSKNRTPDSGP